MHSFQILSQPVLHPFYHHDRHSPILLCFLQNIHLLITLHFHISITLYNIYQSLHNIIIDLREVTVDDSVLEDKSLFIDPEQFEVVFDVENFRDIRDLFG